MRETITVTTKQREELVDITAEVQAIVKRSSIQNGFVAIYV